MNLFNDMKISTRLIAGFTVLELIAASLGVFVYNSMNSFTMNTKVLAIIIVQVVLAFIFSTVISKSISESINKIVKTANKLAVGESNIEIETGGNDETGTLMVSLRKIAERMIWYEGIIDAVPFPIHVTDGNMKWTYMNKAFEKLMIEQGVVRERKDGYGKDCSNAGANICNTKNCGIKQLLKGTGESFFDWCGMSCKQDTSYLKNAKGENIGFVEVVTDLSSILQVSDYTKIEVERLAANLDLLAKGDLNLDFQVKEADKYTVETRENFIKINHNLQKTKDAVGKLINDVFMLSDSAIAGNLGVRADATKHEGEYRKIVEEVNHTLDTVNDKNTWYEAIIDAVPFPIHVTDNDMTWTYMNKAFEKLMIEQGIVKERKDGYGKACSNAGANICNTQNCGIKQLLKGKGESFFDWCGMSCKQDTSYLKNAKGENVGFVEVVTDLTSILQVSDYTKTEVDRLAANLDLIAKGDLNLDFKVREAGQYTAETRDNFLKINNNLEKTKEAIGKLINDVFILSDSAIAGKLDVRADATKHEGEYRKIVDEVNHTLDTVNDKNSWYEAIIDAVPFPIHVTDNDMNWTYMNKHFEKLMIEQGVVRERKDGYGKACSNAGATICSTQNCGIKQLLKGNGESYFDWCGMNCKQDTSYLKNAKGESVGFVEVVTDLTSILRVSDYTKHEVERLASNLEMLAKGNINMDFQVKEADKYTEETRNDFIKINLNLEKAKDAIALLITDIVTLSDKAIEGELSTRIDKSKHEGDFKKIVEGVNYTLDSVIEPVQEAAAVLDEMAKGNLQLVVQGAYKGDHAKIKDALNETISNMASYVTEISTALDEMSKGNLVVGIDSYYLGDFAQIKIALNKIIKSFNEVLNDINNASSQVASGARQVSDSAQALSQGSTEQASSIEELTASVEEIAEQTKQNAINANKANELALLAKEYAVKGNDQMKEMLEAMDGINGASANISKIIKVIDEIAFQTNILALNAAVEAARAGQHGKGFAVVAEEVRNLAARSANAAKETTVLIEGSIKKVEGGTKFANDTAEALNKIVDGIAKASNLVGEIAAASNEQASGIAQINQGIMQVSEVTQSNSATAEQSAAASEELSSQSEVLKGMVGRFQLKKGGTSSYSGLEEVSPDLTRMHEGMYEKNRGISEVAATKKRIVLTDREFGKY